jgi:hypothetical protein
VCSVERGMGVKPPLRVLQTGTLPSVGVREQPHSSQKQEFPGWAIGTCIDSIPGGLVCESGFISDLVAKRAEPGPSMKSFPLA